MPRPRVCLQALIGTWNPLAASRSQHLTASGCGQTRTSSSATIHICCSPTTMLLKPREAHCSSLLPAIPGASSSGIPVFGPCRDNSGPGPLHPVGLPWDEPGSNSATTPAAHNLSRLCMVTCRYRGSLLSRTFSLLSTYHGTCAKVWSLCIVWTSLPGCCFLVTDRQDSQTVDPQGF